MSYHRFGMDGWQNVAKNVEHFGVTLSVVVEVVCAFTTCAKRLCCAAEDLEKAYQEDKRRNYGFSRETKKVK